MKFSATIKDHLQKDRFIIPYRVYGNGGPHIICLNGIQQSMAMWHGFIRRFASDYRIVLFDFPGQGKADVLSGTTRLSLEEELEILHEVVTATGIDDFIICAASWGGIVALEFAGRYPNMVKRLILGSLGTRANKRMMETIQSGCRVDPDDREKFSETLINSFGQNLPEVIKKRIIKQFAAMSQEQLNTFCEHGLFIIDAEKLENVVNFKEIQTETILLRGETDTIIDFEDVKYLASKIPNCQMKIIQNVGHFLHLESEEVLEIYNSFFQ